MWSLGLDGTGLHSITLNDTVRKITQEKQDQFGNTTVFVPSPLSSVPSFDIMLGTLDKDNQQVLYADDTTPELPVFSHDGKYVLFASVATSSGDKPSEDGIYVITLDTPIPEFPFAVPVLLVSIISLIMFYRIKFRQ